MRGVFQAVDVKLHLQAADHPQALLREQAEGVLQLTARVKGHGRAVLKHGLALHPTSFLGPRQNVKALGVGHQQQVAGELKARQLIGHARFKHFERRAVRRVFEHQGAHHAHAAAQGVHSRFGRQRFSAQHAVRVAPRKTHQFQAAAFNQTRGVSEGVVLGFAHD